ncbi:Vacuolar sorting protein 9 (VPS9) domain [Pelomyxa schiedti]|nr:Vacuolar sorting protein 9 (VPS9) domain [Pelomyxa schiedti]
MTTVNNFIPQPPTTKAPIPTPEMIQPKSPSNAPQSKSLPMSLSLSLCLSQSQSQPQARSPPQSSSVWAQATYRPKSAYVASDQSQERTCGCTSSSTATPSPSSSPPPMSPVLDATFRTNSAAMCVTNLSSSPNCSCSFDGNSYCVSSSGGIDNNPASTTSTSSLCSVGGAIGNFRNVVNDGGVGIRTRSRSGDSATVSGGGGRWTASRSPSQRNIGASAGGPSSILLHSRSAQDLHCLRTQSMPTPSLSSLSLSPLSESTSTSIATSTATSAIPIAVVDEASLVYSSSPPFVSGTTPPLSTSVGSVSQLRLGDEQTQSASLPSIPLWTSPNTKIRSITRLCGRPLQHNIRLHRRTIQGGSSTSGNLSSSSWELPKGSEKLLSTIGSGPTVGGTIAVQPQASNLLNTFLKFKEYHTQWSQEEIGVRQPQVEREQSTRKNREILNTTGDEVVTWYQNWLRSVRNMTEDDFDLDTFVYHFRDVANLKAHPLGPTLKRGLQQVCSELSIVPDIGTDSAAEEVMRIAEEHAMNLGNDVVKLYRPLLKIQEVVDRAILELIFQHCFSVLWDGYTTNSSVDDENYRSHASKYLTISPAHMGVRKQLWLNENPKRGAAQPFGDFMPYGTAIEEAKRLSHAKTPWAKTKCLIDVARAIKSCVDTFWGKVNAVEITADDFLPLFAFVLIKANLQHPFAECKFIEHFLSDDDLRGEAGYIFVTFQTCLAMIPSLRPEEIVSALHGTL